MGHLHLDFETYSEVDLKKCGADVYARHPSTEIMCLAWALDDDEVWLWTPDQGGNNCIKSLVAWMQAGETVVAHNAAFEYLIWNHVGVKKYGWPELKIEQLECTMAMAYAMSLPGSLENAGAALGLDVQKDAAGGRVMRQLAQPKDEVPCIDCFGEKTVEWPHPHFPPARVICKTCDGRGILVTRYTPHAHPEKFEQLYAYCKNDVAVERALYARLMKLSPSETEVWRIDQEINQRGIAVDLPAVKKAIEIVAIEKKRLDDEMRRVTDNQVAGCNAVADLKRWLKFLGIDVDGLAKADVLELLETDSLPSQARSALLLRQEAAKTSTAKLEALAHGACPDGRIRSTLQYHGAGTGRWAGRRLQVQNFPRPKISHEDVEGVFRLLSEETLRGSSDGDFKGRA